MKSLKWPLIVSLVAGVLTIGVIVLLRHNRLRLTPHVQVKRYPHQHLPPVQWEPRAKLNTVEYLLHKDETLASVAVKRYGHHKYDGIIKLYNRIQDEKHIEADFHLRLPDISVILAEEGVTKVAPAQVEMILCSRAKYDKVVDQLWALRAQFGNTYSVPEDVKRELLEAADDLWQATEDLKVSRPRITKVPTSMIGQLEQSMAGMREIAEGGHADPNGYDIDMVQQRYGLALTYAIIWARDGFK